MANFTTLLQSGRVELGALAHVLRKVDGDSPVLWEAVEFLFRRLRLLATSDADRQQLAKLAVQTSASVVKRIGLAPGGGRDAVASRPHVLWLRAAVGDDATAVAEAKRLTDRWLAGTAKADPELLRVAIAASASDADAALFDRVAAKLSQAATPEQRITVLEGLAGFEKPALVQRALDMTLSSAVRTQDVGYVYRPLLENPNTQSSTLMWLYRHAEDLSSRLPPFVLKRVAAELSYLCEQSAVGEVSKVLGPKLKRTEGGARALAQALEQASICATHRTALAGKLADSLKVAPPTVAR